MSITENPAGQNTHLVEQSQLLRQELKEWEKSFAATHEGQKASREDIRRDADIAQKYKLYSKLRAGPSSSPLPAKRPPPPSERQTPRKRRRNTDVLHPAAIDPYDPPVSAHKTPTTYRISIGPTPQKDGRVLGLFDLLSPASNPAPTPSKQARGLLQPTHSNALATPSRRRLDASQGAFRDRPAGTPLSQRLKGSSLGASNSNSLMTPSARRTATTPQRTPASGRGGVSKLRFDDTPVFLQRHSQRAYMRGRYNCENEGAALNDEDGAPISWSPMMKVRLPAKPAGKGLSALVKGLRAMEDERLDEEMALLREMEGGSDPAGRGAVAVAPAGQKPTSRTDNVFVQDSQAPDMPLGPDGHHESDSEDDKLEGKGRDGKPLRVWKKRGQKRSTRMVVMKPSRGKWKPEPKWEGGQEDEEEQVIQVIPETQVPVTTPVADEVQDDLSLPEDDFEEQTTSESGGEPSLRKPKKNKKKKKKKNEAAQTTTTTTTTTTGKPAPEPSKAEDAPQKKKKKVGPTANANFRALKIRGKGSKGRGARFGRRR